MTAAVRTPAARSSRLLWPGLVVLVVLLVAVSVLGVAVGARPIAFPVVIDALTGYVPEDDAHQAVWGRVPRLFAGLLVGAALGPAGALLQGVTRNPLADPGLLGVNAGSAFAVVCAIGLLGITTPLCYVWFAFAGALVAATMVYSVGSLGRGGATPAKITLAGAALHAALTGLTTAVLITDATTFDQYRFWTVGSLTGRQMDIIAQLAPFIGFGLLLALAAGHALNVLALGDDLATGLGTRVATARAWCVAAAVVLCGAATAIAGPVWFVGLLAPHLARAVTGPDYRWLLPYSMLIAPILLLGSDVLGRVVAPPGEVQVGIVLAFVGAPFLILLIRYRRVAGL